MDITDKFAWSFVYISNKHGILYMSRMFLLHLLSLVYETFNTRDAERRIADVYRAIALGLCMGHHRQMLSPYV